MNRRLVRFASIVLATACVGLPCKAQNSKAPAPIIRPVAGAESPIPVPETQNSAAVPPRSATIAKSFVPAPETQITVFTSADGLRLNLHFDNRDVIDVLKTISMQGNVEVIVGSTVHGKVSNIHIDGVRPEDALEQVCREANLTWTIQNKTYVIIRKLFKAPSNLQPKISISLEFQDVPLAAILTMIGEQGNIRVILGGTVTGDEKLNYIRLKNETPESAIQKISQAADFVWTKLDDKTYSITKP